MKITKRIIEKLIIELSQEYEVRVHFTKSMPDDGCARYWNNSISISSNQSAIGMLSTFFHEMGHIFCWKNSLWTSYHLNKAVDDITSKEKQKFIKVALRAERWVEHWAKIEMKKHFPKIKYSNSYHSLEDGKLFTNEMKKMLRYE